LPVEEKEKANLKRFSYSCQPGDRWPLSEERMSFFNSPLVRITLAILGGAFYALLTYTLTRPLHLSSSIAVQAAFFVYLLYLGSRLLLFSSGIDSPYYRRERKEPSKTLPRNNSFHETVQWVGKFYHRHDIVLFFFLCLLSAVFLISLVMDGFGGKPLGDTIQTLWNAVVSFL